MMGWMGIRELGIGVKEGGRRATDPIQTVQSIQLSASFLRIARHFRPRW